MPASLVRKNVLGSRSMDLLTTKEVARYLRVNEYTVYRWLSQKKLPAYKVGAQWRINRTALNNWLKRRKITPNA
jgi:excisionase family DNA binding protein